MGWGVGELVSRRLNFVDQIIHALHIRHQPHAMHAVHMAGILGAGKVMGWRLLPRECGTWVTPQIVAHYLSHCNWRYATRGRTENRTQVNEEAKKISKDKQL